MTFESRSCHSSRRASRVVTPSIGSRSGTSEPLKPSMRSAAVGILPGDRVSFAGLKDRHARTTQFLTIAGGPYNPFVAREFELEPVGRLSRPYGPRHIHGNRFVLVLRDMSAADVVRAGMCVGGARARRRAELLRRSAVRISRVLGPIHRSRVAAGRSRARLEARPGRAQSFRPLASEGAKGLAARALGTWPVAKARLDRSSTRSIVTYLADHPTDYRGAFARMRRELRRLYFSAFQSHLWNAILGGLIERSTRPDQRVAIELKTGVLPFPRSLER